MFPGDFFPPSHQTGNPGLKGTAEDISNKNNKRDEDQDQ